MWSLSVVKRQEPVQRPLQGAGRGEVVPAELDAPVLMENRPLQPFHEKPHRPRFRHSAHSPVFLFVSGRKTERQIDNGSQFLHCEVSAHTLIPVVAPMMLFTTISA